MKNVYVSCPWNFCEGLAIYGAEITNDLQFKGIAGTSDNLIKIVRNTPALNWGIPYDSIDSNIIEEGLVITNPLDCVTKQEYFY